MNEPTAAQWPPALVDPDGLSWTLETAPERARAETQTGSHVWRRKDDGSWLQVGIANPQTYTSAQVRSAGGALVEVPPADDDCPRCADGTTICDCDAPCTQTAAAYPGRPDWEAVRVQLMTVARTALAAHESADAADVAGRIAGMRAALDAALVALGRGSETDRAEQWQAEADRLAGLLATAVGDAEADRLIGETEGAPAVGGLAELDRCLTALEARARIDGGMPVPLVDARAALDALRAGAPAGDKPAGRLGREVAPLATLAAILDDVLDDGVIVSLSAGPRGCPRALIHDHGTTPGLVALRAVAARWPDVRPTAKMGVANPDILFIDIEPEIGGLVGELIFQFYEPDRQGAVRAWLAESGVEVRS